MIKKIIKKLVTLLRDMPAFTMKYFEQGHSISYKIARAPSEDKDQLAHMHRPICVFSLDPNNKVPCENSDQTARMGTLIRVFSGCKLV